MHLSMIVAADQNNGIGHRGNQPFFISNDLKRFKALTTGHTVLMGRKTFEALPKGALPNRRNIVLTRNKRFNAPGVEVIHATSMLNSIIGENEEVFVIGGGDIYRLFLSGDSKAHLVSTIHMTCVHLVCEEIDTWFPKLNENEWVTTENQGPFTDEKSGLSYSYVTLKRVG